MFTANTWAYVRKTIAALGVVALVAGVFGGPAQARADRLDRQLRFDIPAQPLATALVQFSKQAEVQLVTSSIELGSRETTGISGHLSIRRALESLLDRTGLVYSLVGENTVAIGSAGGIPNAIAIPVLGTDSSRTPSAPQAFSNRETPDSGTAKKPSFWSRFRLAQAESPSKSDTQSSSENQTSPQSSDKNSEKRVELGEIVVTGTNLRGVAPAGSPLMSFDREDIDRSGHGTVYQFVASLPQNFNGGVTESAAGGTTFPAGGSFTQGSGFNLRGLGNGATLTLVDGRRLAPAGFGEFVDVSMIPSVAIDRVDVLGDGASAIYGSDAVSGVVNLVLRRDFDGAETSIRYGSVTEGDSTELRAQQVFGQAWTGGHFIAGAEYYHRTSLSTSERSFTEGAPDPSFLLPEQERASLMLMGSQQFGQVDIFGFALHSEREFAFTQSNFGLVTQGSGDNSQNVATLGGSVEVSNWNLELAGSFSDNSSSAINDFGGGFTSTVDITSSTWALDGIADGVLFSIPGGDVRAAIGVHYREESFERQGGPGEASRDITAFFLESNVPIVSGDNAVAGIEQLTLSAAIRYESYSDFGETTNPKIGLVWSPTNGLALRGSYGTSFRAPTFDQLDESPNAIIILPIPDPVLGGTTPTIAIFGNNANLGPEEATTYTLGFDIEPPTVPSFAAHFTYFDINYRDRIGGALPGGILTLFDNIDDLGPLGFRNPDLAFLTALAADPLFVNPFGFALTDVGAFGDLRLRNLAETSTSGIDLGANYLFELSSGELNLSVNVQYLLESEVRSLPSQEDRSILDTVYNPNDLRIRAGAVWSSGSFSTSAILNYTSEYTDDRFSPSSKVASWTTLDWNAALEFGRGTRLSLSVLNVFDKDPPFVVDPINSINFDGANASALGRFVALQLSQTW